MRAPNYPRCEGIHDGFNLGNSNVRGLVASRGLWSISTSPPVGEKTVTLEHWTTKYLCVLATVISSRPNETMLWARSGGIKLAIGTVVVAMLSETLSRYVLYT